MFKRYVSSFPLKYFYPTNHNNPECASTTVPQVDMSKYLFILGIPADRKIKVNKCIYLMSYFASKFTKFQPTNQHIELPGSRLQSMGPVAWGGSQSNDYFCINLFPSCRCFRQLQPYFLIGSPLWGPVPGSSAYIVFSYKKDIF